MKLSDAAAPAPLASEDLATALARFGVVRGHSDALTAGLEPEDTVLQSMELASPTGWQLAHTTWFFEEFLLRKLDPDYTPLDPAHRFLFNSYYDAIGARTARDARGLMSRPTLREIRAYRAAIDERVAAALADPALTGAARAYALQILELGCHHEQQHQELIVTDLKHAFSFNPLQPPMAPSDGSETGAMLGLDDPRPLPKGAATFARFEEGPRQIGHTGQGFHYDNETPRHTVHVHAFELAERPVTAREFIAFIEDGGYEDHRHWLSAAWERVGARAPEQRMPLYWRLIEGVWTEYTTRGRASVELDAPVRHISYDEADAFARWSGARLPTEAEWEVADAESGGLAETGHVWEWTSSAYAAYPGYSPEPGALGEYNGKFMCGQFVLRGSSCATPPGHSRATYRNFFPPEPQWQFSGLRLARNPQ